MKIDNIECAEPNENLIKDICSCLNTVHGLEEFNVVKWSDDIIDIVPYNSACYIEVCEIDNNQCVVDVMYSGVIYSSRYDQNHYYCNKDDIISILEKGMKEGYSCDGERYDFIIGKDIMGFFDSDFNSTDEVADTDYMNGNISRIELSSKPIVIGTIEQLRVVPLKYEGNVISYRFKTNLGAFDISRSVAERYGLNNIKTDKFIPLENINGVFMSANERKLHLLVPDVSGCEEDCTKLINAIFEE